MHLLGIKTGYKWIKNFTNAKLGGYLFSTHKKGESINKVLNLPDGLSKN